jgi:hypothetical protein
MWGSVNARQICEAMQLCPVVDLLIAVALVGYAPTTDTSKASHCLNILNTGIPTAHDCLPQIVKAVNSMRIRILNSFFCRSRDCCKVTEAQQVLYPPLSDACNQVC